MVAKWIVARTRLVLLLVVAALVSVGYGSMLRGMMRKGVDYQLRSNGHVVAGAVEAYDYGNEIYPDDASVVRWTLQERERPFPQNPIEHSDLVIYDVDEHGLLIDPPVIAIMAGNAGYFKGAAKAYTVFVYGRDGTPVMALGRRENGDSFPKDESHART